MPVALGQLLVSFGCATILVGLPTMVLVVSGFDPMLGLVLLLWIGAGLVIHRWIWAEG